MRNTYPWALSMAYRAVTTQEAPLILLQTRFQMDVEAPATL